MVRGWCVWWRCGSQERVARVGLHHREYHSIDRLASIQFEMAASRPSPQLGRNIESFKDPCSSATSASTPGARARAIVSRYMGRFLVAAQQELSPEGC